MKSVRFLPVLFLWSLLGSLAAEVRLNEFLASNQQDPEDTEAPTLEETADWIEVYNAGTETIDLEGYYLTDSAAFSPTASETFWRFPAVSIEPEGYLLVFATGEEAPMPGALQANFRVSRSGERLGLIAPDGTTVLTDFSPTFPEQEPNVSYGLNRNGEWVYMLEPTPGERNNDGVSGFVEEVTFSVKHGFHDAPIALELTTGTEEAEIWYTLSDLEPDEGSLFFPPTGERYTEPIVIDKTTVVRAVARKPRLQESVIRTQTYLFLDDVLHQPDLPEGFPERWGSRPSDYEMDPDVVGDIYSEEEVKAALLSAPTISLVTENDNLFDGRTGIYANSQAKDLVNDGIFDQWERPVSIEMFGFPHGQTIQANAGIRMQGNASRSPNRVKHNMRVIFRAHYGPGKLDFRMFEDSEVTTFNSINLRSNNGDSWIHPGVRVRAQYIRDQWHREVQRRMGQPNQSQIYAHVYINGLYWGMYHVFERFEASLLAEHFGGDEDDWDALQDTPAFQDIVVNGSDEAYEYTHELAQEDLSVQENYDALLEYVDVDNLIDYLLINFYSGNQDWDHKNMRYGRRRTPVEGAVGNGWMFFAWDSERAGLNGLNTQSLFMDNTTKRTNLGPTALNAAMHDHPDYHLRFADRVVKHLFNGGELTPEGAADSWNDLADVVYEPLIGESARWGDLHASTPETREGNWQRQLDRENEEWFPERTEVLLDQLADRQFIPRRISFPQFQPFGGVVEEGAKVTMRIFNDTIFNPIQGDIHYTLNGEDPRLPDASLHPEAIPYDPAAPPVISRTTEMKGRVYDPNGGWSPLAETVFMLGERPTRESLVISEIHYAPGEPSESEAEVGFEAAAFEFVEMTNVSAVPLDLSGLQFTRGVTARVAEERKALLAPGEYALIVADETAFALRYPDVDSQRVIGEFTEETRLDNNGERLSLRDRQGLLLHTVRYNDRTPWPEWENEAGHSLGFVGGTDISLVASPEAWVREKVGGSPGSAPVTGGDGGGEPVGGGLSDWLASHGIVDPLKAPTLKSEAPALLYYALGVDDFEGGADLGLTLREDEGGRWLRHGQRQGADDLRVQLQSSDDLKVWVASDESGEVVESRGMREVVEYRLSPDGPRYWRLSVSVR